MHGEDWRISCFSSSILSGGRDHGGVWISIGRGGARGRARGRTESGRRDEALEEADWEMSAGGGSRERDCAGRAVAAERGCGVGLSGGLAGGPMALWVEGRALDHGRGGGMLRLKFCREVTLHRA